MSSAIAVLQIISALVLLLLILAQNRGEGLSGAAFGGGSGGGGFYGTKRGAEKIMANATVVTAILFVVLSFAASVV